MENKPLSQEQIESIEAINATTAKITFILKELEKNEPPRELGFMAYNEVGLMQLHEDTMNHPFEKKNELLTKAVDEQHKILIRQIKQHLKK